ncbi:unnamed protein product [Meloidogyne enterolobii]|uniref:Uncharacterized protein n=1 Tax=Meloidogyne enterolobii TaxID=390850 RepID=A0ACB0XWJ4_MELEN
MCINYFIVSFTKIWICIIIILVIVSRRYFKFYCIMVRFTYRRIDCYSLY